MTPAFEPFVRFAKRHVESGDLDPSYPVLKRVYDVRGYNEEQRLWFTLLYLTWYRLDSAEIAFGQVPMPTRSFPDIRLPTGTERRGFRGNARAHEFVSRVVDAALTNHGALNSWVKSFGTGEAGWRAVRNAVQSFRDGGPWSSYKFADLLKNVHGYSITANDIGVGSGSATAGPIPGMVRVTGKDWRICAVDVALQRELLALSQAHGVPFTGLDQLETSLCDFNSLCKGRYYVGHDIDSQQEHFFQHMSLEWWDARRAVFAPEWLGEVQGWIGVRKNMNRWFLEKGTV